MKQKSECLNLKLYFKTFAMCENPVPIAQTEQKFQQVLEETGTIPNFEFVDCCLKYIEEVPDVGVQWRDKHFYVKVDRLYEDRRCRTRLPGLREGGFILRRVRRRAVRTGTSSSMLGRKLLLILTVTKNVSKTKPVTKPPTPM